MRPRFGHRLTLQHWFRGLAPCPEPARRATLVVALTATGACGGPSEAPTTNSRPAPTIRVFDNPAPVGSSSPGLTISPDGRVYLSWQERNADSTLVLRYAARDASSAAWSAPRAAHTGRNMLASATDVPGIHELPNGALVAIWRGSHGEAGYDVVMAHSNDRGATWSAPRSPHSDVTPTEHGFVSWLQLGDTSAIVWLDGRLNASPNSSKHATQLVMASFDARGNTTTEAVIDSLICDCCHTSSALVPGGVVIAYRDRQAGEIRDISVARLSGNAWRAPVPVHRDNWRISGCPVNGPAIASQGTTVAVAWFTAANDSARVRLAFSTDTAATFGEPIEINEGFPDGKAGVVLTTHGDAVVSWIERQGATALLRVRSVERDGTRSAITTVAALGDGKRAGGAPKLLVQGGSVLLAWTDAASNRVQTATVTVPGGPP